MNDPGVEHPIQLQPDVGASFVPSDGLAESPIDRDSIQRLVQRQRAVTIGTLFGTFVGLLMGAVVGAACCWLAGQFDFFGPAVLIGILAGAIVGTLLGFMERKIRGELVRPDIATIIGIVYGLLPALLLFLGMGSVSGRFSGYLYIGAVFAGPMMGLVVGGVLDRAFEEYQRQAWDVALPFAAAGVAVCVGLVCLFDAVAYGPDPKEVGRKTEALLISEWSKSPNNREAVIHSLTLVRKNRMSYTGFAEATFSGRRQRLLLEVAVEGEILEVGWSSESEGEHGR